MHPPPASDNRLNTAGGAIVLGVRDGTKEVVGLTDALADAERLARNTVFDEEPCTEVSSEAIDFRAASEFFAAAGRPLTPPKRRSLGLLVEYGGREVPTQGAVLLFGKDRRRLFPDATIRCARFLGTDTARFADQTEIDEHLPRAVESVIAFIERHTHQRIEITNPGLLPFGMTLEAALSGVSRLRNRVIGRTFRELKLIEQWGSGIGRMPAVCAEAGLRPPRFEEIGTNFRVTLFGGRLKAPALPGWRARLLQHLAREERISTQEAARLWKTSDRTARTRLRQLVDAGVLAEVGTGPKDPRRTYVLKETHRR